MPITVTAPEPLGAIGPGLYVNWQSDFIGPLEAGSTVLLEIAPASAPETPVWRQQVETLAPDGALQVMGKAGVIGQIRTDVQVADGADVDVNVELRDPSNIVLDSGTATLPWTNTAGLGVQAFTAAPTQGGLTAQQAQQLQETWEASAVSKLLDALTLIDISGPGGGFAAADLTFPIFGVIVRITSVPAELAPQTPDGDYWVSGLAVCRVFRGVDLWLRVPVHTSSKIISLYGEALLLGLNPIWGTNWLGNLSVQVTFRDGVTGSVFLMRTP